MATAAAEAAAKAALEAAAAENGEKRQAFDTDLEDTEAPTTTSSKTEDLCAKYGHI